MTFAATGAARQIGLLVRGVVTLPPTHGSVSGWQSSCIASAVALPHAAALMGTTRVDHLDEVLADLPRPPPKYVSLREALE